MLKIAAFGLATALVAGAAIAQSPANPDPKVVQPGAYTVEPGHTQVMFGVSHMGFTNYYGAFPGATGSLKLDPAHPGASTMDVSVPVDHVSTTSAKLDGELKSEAWLDAAKFPAVTFHATRITPTGPTTADVAGDFTLHGVTRPVLFKARFIAAGVNPINKHYTAGFEVTGVIKRSDFGVKTYVPLIGDDVNLMINAAFEKAS